MEDITLLLGKVLGVFFLVTGIVRVAYFNELKEALEEFSQSKMLFYLSGQFFFVLGLFLVMSHTIFTNQPLVIMVTVVSYLLLFKGLVILFLPHSWVNYVVAFFNRTPWFIVGGVFSILLGVAFLLLVFVVPLLL